MGKRVTVTIEGCPVETQTGCSIAACVMQANGPALRQSVSGAPRGPFCGMGVCFECRMTVDGTLHQRTCMVNCRDGMRIQNEPATQAPVTPASKIEADVIVIGAGPGGIAAAVCAAEAGRRVALIDDNPEGGGQIWRRDAGKPPPRLAADWLKRLDRNKVDVFTHTQILGSAGPGTLRADGPAGPRAVHHGRLILACGARERFVPFPGWTLPGVFGAGGLQALVKSGYAVRGQRIVVAGSGPLLLAVAAFLHEHDANVRLVAEQTPRGKLVRFGASLVLRQPAKIAEAIGLRWRVRGVPFRAGCWPLGCEGDGRIVAVTLTDGKNTWTEPCDALACGFGLVPNTELPRHLGCTLDRGSVRVDDLQQTTVPGVYAVGELTGIGGLDKALLEGQIAGWAATDQADRARTMQEARRKTPRFATLLEDTFSLRPELRELARDDTLVCRCEDVPFGVLKQFSDWRDAKLQTRCGTGPCQGRVCGPAVEFLFGWVHESGRLPIFPTALGNLIEAPM
ncbi:MAG: FAD-dependent oxidoreductase [Planctomycetes bacterium]|nr:FAD-dependent oxidoreductase [Planctomycetota bacterium]